MAIIAVVFSCTATTINGFVHSKNNNFLLRDYTDDNWSANNVNVKGRLMSPFRRPGPSLSVPKQSTKHLNMWTGDDMTNIILSSSSVLNDFSRSIGREEAEALAGPFFGVSLFPYLGFLYFLNVKENETPKGIVVGFTMCLAFVFLTIPAAIAAQVLYGVSLADSDWLHGSAESLLTVTNLVTVIAFRQALLYSAESSTNSNLIPPKSVTSYQPMIQLSVLLTILAGLTAIIPAFTGATEYVHTPYLNGFMDISSLSTEWGSRHAEPENALTVACWIIHVTSLVEFLVAMGFAWRWADTVNNPKWKGLTWGLLPLHSSGIVACTYHLFYNQIPLLVPLQASLTCLGNTTAMYAAWRIAISNGWKSPWEQVSFLNGNDNENNVQEQQQLLTTKESKSLIGFEDIGEALSNDNDYLFIVKLFTGCAIASYIIKYGEIWFDFPYDADVSLALSVIFIPSLLNAFKWYKRSLDPEFEGWF